MKFAKSSTDTDDDLLRRIADHRDRGAFELLYRRHCAKVSHYVSRMVRRPELVEEIVDDTFFAVWRSAGAFAGRSSVSTWLVGIGHRQALKAIDRDHRPHEVACDDDELHAHADPGADADPQSNAAAAEMRALIGRGIDALSHSHRSVIELAAVGHSAGEIADIVGCPEATVRTRMFHARQQLKKFIGHAAEPRPVAHLFGSRRHV
jgi:RNA polymerase sigma-70 factor, ECF subfamily